MWCTFTVVQNAEQAQYNIHNVHRDKKCYQQFNEKLTVTHHVDIKKGSSITMWNWKMHPHAHAHTHTHAHTPNYTHTHTVQTDNDYNFLKGNPSWLQLSEGKSQLTCPLLVMAQTLRKSGSWPGSICPPTAMSMKHSLLSTTSMSDTCRKMPQFCSYIVMTTQNQDQNIYYPSTSLQGNLSNQARVKNLKQEWLLISTYTVVNNAHYISLKWNPIYRQRFCCVVSGNSFLCSSLSR